MTRERWIRIAVAAALLALVAYSSWQRWQMLTVSPFPLGVDGYYYPIQLRALLETGTLAYPASPLTFWFMAPFAAATDPITGAKLGAAIGGALVAIPAYGVGAHLGRSRGAGLVAAAVATMSATSAYLSTEFVKQGFGLTVGLAAIWLVLRALESPSTPRSRRRIGFALAGLVAALLAHKLAAALVLAISIPAAFEALRRRGVLRGRRLLYLMLLAGAAAILLLIVGLVAPQRFLSPTDLALVENVFSSEAHWDAPALVRPGLTLVFGHEAVIAAVLGILAAITLVLRPGTRTRSESIVAWAFIALAIVIGLPWLDVSDTQGLAFRLRTSAFVPLAICAAIIAGALAELVAPTRNGAAARSGAGKSSAAEGGDSAHRWQRDGLLALLAVVLVVRAPAERAEGRIVAHPALVTAVMAATTHIPDGATVIVPERHIMFMTAWYTRAPVALRPERVPYGRRVRLLPLHFIEMGSPLEVAIDAARADPRVAEPPIGLHPRHRNGLVLVTEVTWDWILAAVLPPSARSYWERWNTI